MITGSLDNTLKMWLFRNYELTYSVKADEYVVEMINQSIPSLTSL